MFSIFAKRLCGAKYEKILSSCIFSGILSCILYKTEINFEISYRNFLSLSLLLSITYTFSVCHKRNQQKYLQGLFAFPYNDIEVNFYYIITTFIFIFFRSILPLIIIGIMLIKITYLQVVFMLVAAFCSMYTTIYCYDCFVKKRVSFSKISVEEICLHPHKSNSIVRKSILHGSVELFILRYMTVHKRYFLNSIIIVAFVILFSKEQAEMGQNSFLPLNIALLSINSPLGTLLSAEPNLKRRLDTYPNKIVFFFIPYSIFVFMFYIIENLALVASFNIMRIDLPKYIYIIMIFYAIEAAIITSYLEYKKPILNWSVEVELWRHPRKYIVTALLLMEGFLLMLIKGY
jgi:hypothetical protein